MQVAVLVSIFVCVNVPPQPLELPDQLPPENAPKDHIGAGQSDLLERGDHPSIPVVAGINDFENAGLSLWAISSIWQWS